MTQPRVGGALGLAAVAAAGLALGGVAAALTAAALAALGFTLTARVGLCFVAAGASALAVGLDRSVLPWAVLASLAVGVSAGVSPAWRRAEVRAARRASPLTAAAARSADGARLRAIRVYASRAAAASLTLAFPAVVTVACLAVATWSLGRHS